MGGSNSREEQLKKELEDLKNEMKNLSNESSEYRKATENKLKTMKNLSNESSEYRKATENKIKKLEENLKVQEDLIRIYPHPNFTGWNDEEINVGIIGATGVGKSTLVNTLREVKKPKEACKVKKWNDFLNVFDPNKWALTGQNETTMEPKKYKFQDPSMKMISLWDLPGGGTENFKARDYVKKMGVRQQDQLFVLFSERITETVRNIFDEIEYAKIPSQRVFQIKTKFYDHWQNECKMRENDLEDLKDEEEIKQQIKEQKDELISTYESAQLLNNKNLLINNDNLQYIDSIEKQYPDFGEQNKFYTNMRNLGAEGKRNDRLQTCIICNHLRADAIIPCQAKHRFCKECILHWIDQGNLLCFLCRQEFNKDGIIQD